MSSFFHYGITAPDQVHLVLFAFDLYDKDNSEQQRITRSWICWKIFMERTIRRILKQSYSYRAGGFREAWRRHWHWGFSWIFKNAPSTIISAQMQEVVQKYDNQPSGSIIWEKNWNQSWSSYVPIFEFRRHESKIKRCRASKYWNGKPIDKRDLGFVPQPKLDGKLSRRQSWCSRTLEYFFTSS